MTRQQQAAAALGDAARERLNKATVCQEAGERLNNPECIQIGECSWFRHSQDSFRLSNESNLPPGYIEEN